MKTKTINVPVETAERIDLCKINEDTVGIILVSNKEHNYTGYIAYDSNDEVWRFHNEIDSFIENYFENTLIALVENIISHGQGESFELLEFE